MIELEGTDLTTAARKLATNLHEGQEDKAGRAYITHPARVAARVATNYGPEYEAVAWLHDVIEDCQYTAAKLRDAGFPESVVAGVVAMTKLSDDGDDEAIRRARDNEIALVVKAADVADNTDPDRLALLDRPKRVELSEKYARYQEILMKHAAPLMPERQTLNAEALAGIGLLSG